MLFGLLFVVVAFCRVSVVCGDGAGVVSVLAVAAAAAIDIPYTSKNRNIYGTCVASLLLLAFFFRLFKLKTVPIFTTRLVPPCCVLVLTHGRTLTATG